MKIQANCCVCLVPGLLFSLLNGKLSVGKRVIFKCRKLCSLMGFRSSRGPSAPIFSTPGFAGWRKSVYLGPQRWLHVPRDSSGASPLLP